MKTMRKILCTVLAIAMVASCMTVVMAAETAATSATTPFSDVSQDQVYYDAVMTLNAMGVINGYQDGTFKPEQNVTRAEFTAMLMRTLKLGSIGSPSSAGLPFTDVDENNSDISWAIPDINTAYVRGAINGYEDGTFRPSANVAYEEAIKMIVCTLGYVADVNVTPWYANYLTIATQKGITRVASTIGAPETPATRACIAQLLYDSLEVELIEDEKITTKTILSDYLGYTKATGIISSNAQTSLTSPDVNLRDDEITIYAKEPDGQGYETHTYKITDLSLKNYLGYQIDFYYKSTGADPRTLVLSVIKSTEPVTINAANIEVSTSSATQLRYYEDIDDDKEKKVSLASDNVVVYNGKLYGATEAASRFDTSMIPEVGEVKLIDADDDNVYDVIEITDYEIYYVSNKTATNDITDNVIPHTNKTIKLDVAADPNLSIVNKSGNTVSFSSIAVGNIICVAKSNSNGSEVLTKAVVLTDKVTGTITAKTNNTITISGKEYRISNAAPWLNGGTLEAPANQDSGTYYTDINGDIVAYTKNDTASNLYYGYVVAYSIDEESFDGDVTVRVLTTNGNTVYIKSFRSTRVDDSTCSTGAEVIEALENAANNGLSGVKAVQQLIKYTTKTVDGETVFDRIYTAEPVASGGNVTADSLTTLEDITRNDATTYDTSTKMLTSGSIRLSASNAVVISVPESGAYDDFKRTTASSIFKTSGPFSIEVFDVSAANVPKVIVLYGGANASTEIDQDTPVSILDTKASKTNQNNDGEAMYAITGYQSSGSNAKGSFDYWVSLDSDDSVVDDLTRGDIFRVGTDRDGFSLFDNSDGNYYEMLYKVGEDNDFDLFGEISDTSRYAVIIGSVVARDDNTITIVPEKLTAESTTYDESKLQIFDTTDFSGAQVLVYDDGDGSGNVDLLIHDNIDYASALAGLNAYKDGGEPGKVLIYLSRGDIKLLCVLPE